MTLPPPERTLRVIGFDDVPWRHRARGSVGLVGAVCAGTRFEGMVYGSVRRDGWRATLTIERLLLDNKFLPQVHLILRSTASARCGTGAGTASRRSWLPATAMLSGSPTSTRSGASPFRPS